MSGLKALAKWLWKKNTIIQPILRDVATWQVSSLCTYSLADDWFFSIFRNYESANTPVVALRTTPGFPSWPHVQRENLCRFIAGSFQAYAIAQLPFDMITETLPFLSQDQIIQVLAARLCCAEKPA